MDPLVEANPDYVTIMQRMWEPLITPLREVGCREFLVDEFEAEDEIRDLFVPEFLELIPAEWHERARVDALECFVKYGKLLKDSIRLSAVNWIQNPDEIGRPSVFTFNASNMEDFQTNVEQFCSLNVEIFAENEHEDYKDATACETDSLYISNVEIRNMITEYVMSFVSFAAARMPNLLVDAECYFDPEDNMNAG